MVAEGNAGCLSRCVPAVFVRRHIRARGLGVAALDRDGLHKSVEVASGDVVRFFPVDHAYRLLLVNG